MKKTSDAHILALAKTSDGMNQAIRLLMQQHKERLYQHIRRMVVSHDDADDVLQNTFIKAYRALGRFEGKSSLFTWLYRIASNESISFLRKKNRKQEVSDEPLQHMAASPNNLYFDEEAALKKLDKALAALPEKQRQVFVLRYYDEMPYDQMSDVLNTSVGALKASYHHAVKKLERHLTES